ncbi:hypothetical protein CF319_g2405 [Tilletia indica]|uniref:EF-hand domain-containing protein n=1 Tax=Tilletia indica TaxID=43049 RepID=A0A177TFA7_9BASI|nr:hypothetical protein CF319_g2405 [Tilletia indica]KAE8259648.1 hypothetical protein A4X13_0g876 [Tilletia indica]
MADSQATGSNAAAGSSSSASHLRPPQPDRIRGNHPRQSSGVFNAFTAKQIQGFKEAFSLIDQDADGLITRADLDGMMGSLGQPQGKTQQDRLMGSAQLRDGAEGMETINFTQFLTMFGEHLAELDEAHDLIEAFECFDERDDGVIETGEMRYWLSEVGDRMSDKEIDRLLSGPFLDRSGKHFDYKAFVEAVKMTEPAEVS